MHKGKKQDLTPFGDPIWIQLAVNEDKK